MDGTQKLLFLTLFYRLEDVNLLPLCYTPVQRNITFSPSDGGSLQNF